MVHFLVLFSPRRMVVFLMAASNFSVIDLIKFLLFAKDTEAKQLLAHDK